MGMNLSPLLRLGNALISETSADELRKNERQIYRDITSDRLRAEFVAGRVAAHRALAAQALDESDVEVLRDHLGAPYIVGSFSSIAVSISHGTKRAVAVAGKVPRLGIDFCELVHARRLKEIAPRFLASEHALLSTEWSYVACWAAKEAGLKALGLGLLEGGILDCASQVRVVSLEPAALQPSWLQLMFIPDSDGVIAIAWSAERNPRATQLHPQRE
jgi:phosphopantetheinyl transferase